MGFAPPFRSVRGHNSGDYDHLNIDYDFPLAPSRHFWLLEPGTCVLGRGQAFRLPDDRKWTGLQFVLPPGAVVTVYGSGDGEHWEPGRTATYSGMYSFHEEWPLICADYRHFSEPCVLKIPAVSVSCHWGM